jgi:prepilin peptidase CpaA
MELLDINNAPIMIVVIALVLIAVFSDLRWRKIPNCLTLPAIALGLLLNFLGNSWNGLVFAFLGLLVGLGLMILPYMLGGMGGGDVKLMGALGALVGSYSVFNIFLYTSLVGGVIAIVIALANKNLLDTFKRMWLFLKCMFVFRAPEAGTKAFKKSIAIPYGIAIGAGTFLYLIGGKIV